MLLPRCVPLLIAVPAASAAPLTVTCNGGTCSPGWYKVNITVAFAWDPVGVTSTCGCDTQTISSDMSRHFHCVVSYDGTPPTQATADFDVKRDATASNGDRRVPDARSRLEWVVQQPGRNQLHWLGRDIRSRRLQLDHLRWPRQRQCFVRRNMQRPGRERKRTASFGPIKYDATPPSRWVSRSRVARTRTAGTTILSTSMHPGLTASSGSPPATPAHRPEAGRSRRAAPTRPATAASAGTSVNYDAYGAVHHSVTLDRPADSNGWYNHPVHVTFHGTDGSSGISSCTEPPTPGRILRARPSTAPARTKQATGANGTSPAFKYDSTPPTITNLGFEAGTTALPR